MRFVQLYLPPCLKQTGLNILSLAIVVLFAQSCSPYDTREVTAAGEKENIPLPDGSFVDLNAGSTLRYNAADFKEKRIVDLAGEAHFIVRRGGGFLCQTKYGLVRVIGTNFNVYARPDGFAVSCYLGKVEVRYKGEIMALEMNERAVWRKDHFEKMPDYGDRPRWLYGESVYEEALYSSVLAELERQFGIQVKTEITGDPRFTGSFPHVSLQEAMDNIVEPYGYRYEQKGQEMRIWEP
jgi:ferric-dicitrate binding protein FerR (iron transport regulator)